MECALQVQLQLLTAIVKLFLKRPTSTQDLVQHVLSLATQVCLFVCVCVTRLVVYEALVLQLV